MNHEQKQTNKQNTKNAVYQITGVNRVRYITGKTQYIKSNRKTQYIRSQENTQYIKSRIKVYCTGHVKRHKCWGGLRNQMKPNEPRRQKAEMQNSELSVNRA